MSEYELFVIGSGCGMNVASEAMEQEWGVGMAEMGVPGGTCLNRGCIPSKIWIHYADAIRAFEDAMVIGVRGKVGGVDFATVQRRMRDLVWTDRDNMDVNLKKNEGMDYYNERAEFIGPKKLRVGEEDITADHVLITCGVRTDIPDIPGLERAGYLTSENVFDIERLPKSMVILGGGYKACEFGHFFSAMGTRVTMVVRSERLLRRAEPEISEMVKAGLTKYMDIRSGCGVDRVEGGRHRTLHLTCDEGSDKVIAEVILVCTGVRSNTDILHPERSGVAMDDKGYVIVDDHLRTNVDGVWACGDVIGRNMFRHTANYESMVVARNMLGGDKILKENAVPHAVFTWPQVGGVGLTEAEAVAAGHNVLVGHVDYDATTMGYSLGSPGLAKVIVDHDSYRILGAHVCGHEAAALVQPLVYLMNCGEGTIAPIFNSQVIHPALNEVISYTLGNLHHHHKDQVTNIRK